MEVVLHEGFKTMEKWEWVKFQLLAIIKHSHVEIHKSVENESEVSLTFQNDTFAPKFL